MLMRTKVSRHVETVTGEIFYEKMREDIISDGRELGASEEEINVWLKEYDSIDKPIKYYYAESYSNILDVLFFIGWVLFLNIAIALSGVFADEKTYRTYDSYLYITCIYNNLFFCTYQYAVVTYNSFFCYNYGNSCSNSICRII